MEKDRKKKIEKKKRNLNTVKHSIKKLKKPNIFRKDSSWIVTKEKLKIYLNFNCGHIVNIVLTC